MARSWGGDSSAVGINDRGVVVGIEEKFPGDAFGGFTWSRQRGIRRLAELVPEGPSLTFPSDISRGGLIVGSSIDEAQSDRATLWVRRNRIVNLSPNLGVESHAAAINDKGRIAGTITFSGGGSLTLTRAAVWRIDRRFFDPPDPKEINQLCKRPRH